MKHRLGSVTWQNVLALNSHFIRRKYTKWFLNENQRLRVFSWFAVSFCSDLHSWAQFPSMSLVLRLDGGQVNKPQTIKIIGVPQVAHRKPGKWVWCSFREIEFPPDNISPTYNANLIIHQEEKQVQYRDNLIILLRCTYNAGSEPLRSVSQQECISDIYVFTE